MAGKAKKWYEVRCDRHGTVESDDKSNLRRVTVGTPHGKRMRRHGGCPVCKVEAREQKVTNE